MRMSTLLALVTVLTGNVVAAVPAYAVEPSCHFLPITDSAASLKQARSVAVLYSENTLGTLEYLENYHAVALKGAKNPQLNSRISQAFVSTEDARVFQQAHSDQSRIETVGHHSMG